MVNSVTSTGHGLADNLMPSTQFGKYTLIAKIGHGGMAEVFLGALAGPAGFTKLAVLKRVHPHLLSQPALIGMFQDEARLAARLSHPNVVQTYEVGDVEGQHFLTMEYLEGQSLARTLKYAVRTSGKGVPLGVGIKMFVDALDGLHYAHTLADFDGTQLNVIHRDISPGNIFITYDGQVKLLDFGIAKAGTQLMETRAGQVKGKFAYIAPEQAKPGGHDHRADIWSMGVTMWETFVGRRLFKGETEITTLHNAMNAEIPPLDGECDVPPELSRIVSKALSRDVNGRYSSAAEMRDELEVLLVSQNLRVGRNEIGALMLSLFDKERTEQRDVLSAYMKGTPSTFPSVESNGPNTGVRQREAAAAAALPSSASDSANSASRPNTAEQVAEIRDRRKWLIPLFLLFAAMVGGVAAYFFPGDKEEAPVAEVVSNLRPTKVEPTLQELPKVGETENTAVTERVAPSGDAPSGDAPSGDAPSGDAPSGDAPSGDARSNDTAATMRRPSAKGRKPRGMKQTPKMVVEEDPQPETAVKAAGTGHFTLATVPWSEVFLGGKSLGTTPILKKELPVGSHTLRLVNSEKNLKRTYVVRIKEGEHTRKRIGL